MLLNELLKAIEVVNNREVEVLEVNKVTYHSQKVEKGDLFVCVKGYKTDGHKYLADAVKRGATAAVVEDFQENIEIPQYVVNDSRVALAKLGAKYYQNPSSKMTMIGITATNGKTTTSYMTNAILEKEGRRTGLIGTVVVKNGDKSFPAELTTPESLDLQNYLAEMVENDVTHVMMEVSSAALELSRVEGVDFDIVSLNNMSKEHMEMHGTFEKYFEAKSRLIRNASENSYAVLNLDDQYSASLVDKTKAKVISFGLESKEGYLHCKNLDLSTGRGKFTVEILKPFDASGIKYEPSEFEVELAVPGLHSVYNAMVAIAISLLSGVRVSTIQQTLKEFSGVPRRFEFIYEEEIKVVDDHFANPGNINVTLQTLDFMDYENLQLVYAIRGQRGATINRENAEVVVKWAEKLKINEVIATRSISHTTSKDVVTDDEVKAFLEVMDQANINVHLYDELPEAIHNALSKSTKGDLVLLAGCQGMDYGAGIALEALNKENAEVK